MKILVCLAVVLLAILGIRLLIPHLGSSVAGGVVEIDNQKLLADCPETPNCHKTEFTVAGDPAQAIANMAAIVEQQKGAQIVTQEASYLHATFDSPWLGFIDDVEFLLTEASPSPPVRLLVRSASRLGHSDLGANAERVEQLRSLSQGQI